MSQSLGFSRLQLPGIAACLWCAAALAFGFPATSGAAPPDAECEFAARDAWRQPDRWGQLRRGMSRYDVMRTLGEPGKITLYDGFERWEYPDLLGGRVHFDDAGHVAGWREPRP